MVNGWELLTKEHNGYYQYPASRYRLTKTATGVEILDRDEENKVYRVTLVPWHRIDELVTNGTLERK